MGLLYDVTTERFGTILLEEENIGTARARARKMFPKDSPRVTRHVEERPCCDRCDSRPCVCP